MRVLLCITKAGINHILSSNRHLLRLPFRQVIQRLYDQSLFMTLSVRPGPNSFLTVVNSRALQEKWAQENDLRLSTDWIAETQASQIESFQPDVVYTNNVHFITREF